MLEISPALSRGRARSALARDQICTLLPEKTSLMLLLANAGLPDSTHTNTPPPADPADPPPLQCPSAPIPPAALAPSPDIEDYLDQFPPGATVVRTCFKVGGVPVGLDRAAVSSWCNKKADVFVFGNFTKQLVSLEIGAQNRFALLCFCGSPSTKLNYFF